MKNLKTYWQILKKSGSGFIDDNAFKLSASLSYYTIFSIGPVLIIVISLAGLFWGREAVQGQIFYQIDGMIGKEAAVQVQEIIKNTFQTGKDTIGTIIGIVLLVVGATGVFIEMQDSINSIWSVKAKPKKGWLKLIMNRVISFSMIVSLGFILLVSLVISAFLDAMSKILSAYFEDVMLVFFMILNYIVVLAVVTILFAIIFKVLPDAKLKWRDALIGAAFTAVLFLLGKFGISFYLGQSELSTTYGAAASIVILLTWVYYSSLILFFGAEFTKAYAVTVGGGIHPTDTGVLIKKVEEKEVPEAKQVPRESLENK